MGKAGQVIDSFDYSLKLNGQERNYRGMTYQGIYFGGSEELKLNLPNKTIDAIVLDSGVELGAFGGVNAAKDTVYLGVGANGIVKGRVQFPNNIPFIGGFGADVTDLNLVIGGQTTFPIRNVSVSEGMKQAFNNMDIYLGAMVGVNIRIVDARVWVLVPHIINTNFKKGGGWDIEYRLLRSLPEWNWADHGVEPLVQAASPEDGEEYLPMLMTQEPFSLENSGVNTQTITVNANAEDTPYILLAFDNSIAEEEIRGGLSVKRQGENDPSRINWVSGSGQTDPDASIIAASDIIRNKTDEQDYRVVMLRLPVGGTYEVNTGSLEPKKHQETAVTPFEELDLTLNGSLSGQIKYAETGTKYVLRTYLGTEEGGADYLIEEQAVTDSASISVNIPAEGTLAPTGSYYVTSFLMTEKTFDMEDGTTKTAMVGIDSQPFAEQVSYTNTNQPEAPTGVSLIFTGNEVMRAEWQPVADADGYAVTIARRCYAWLYSRARWEASAPDANEERL